MPGVTFTASLCAAAVIVAKGEVRRSLLSVRFRLRLQRVVVMGKKIYVGNLPWSATSASLESLFAEHGPVTSAEVVSDRDTGRSRGFGFVEMATDDACQRAISALNGTQLDGRELTVNEARERAARPSGGGGGGGRGYGGGGGGGGGRGGYGGGGGGRGYGGGGGGGYGGGGGGRGGYGGGRDRD